MGPKKHPINYVYFISFFLFLILLVLSSIVHKETLWSSQFFFFFYALGQIVLEISFFIFFTLLLDRYLGKRASLTFIGLTFLFSFVHLFDFMMDRILDLSIWEALNVFVFNETWENFILLLDASGVPIWAWLIFFILIAALPLIGIGLYLLSERLCQKRPLFISSPSLLQAFVCIPCALLFWDYSASKVIHPDAYTAFIQSLPWKFTFLRPENVVYPLPKPLAEPLHEAFIAEEIEALGKPLEKRPNIYLFIAESLRADAITKDIAPNLYQFKQENYHFEKAFSNANASHQSWFSIFHSQFSYYWDHLRQKKSFGSPSLALLKKWGYQIHLYTSAQLSYYGMEELLFGKNLALLDTRKTFHHAPPIQPSETDALALDQMLKDLRENRSLREGQVFIVFWDTTHFDYNWPKNWTPKFTPFAKELAYFRAFHTQKMIQEIKNRYWNSVNYMDFLFGRFIDQVPNREEAIVIFTGDHGEEFFEQGHLFHNSHIVHQQTHIPLFMKFGNNEKPMPQTFLASQMDIFPTILDYVSGGITPSFLQGNSLYQKSQWPYVVISRFNAGASPYEFAIHNGKNKLLLQFSDRKKILSSKSLQILSLRTFDDKTIPHGKNYVSEWVDKEFGAALVRLIEK